MPAYADLRVTVAAQRVQRSGYPSAYAVYEDDARALASAMTGYSPAAFWCHQSTPEGSSVPAAQRARAMRAALLAGFGPTSVQVAPGAALQVPVSSREQGWSVASYVVAHAAQLGVSQRRLPRPPVDRRRQRRMASRRGCGKRRRDCLLSRLTDPESPFRRERVKVSPDQSGYLPFGPPVALP